MVGDVHNDKNVFLCDMRMCDVSLPFGTTTETYEMEYHVSYFIFFIAISLSHALYFHIGETEKKCFIEEIPDETMVVGACFNEKFVVVAVC